MSTLLSRRLLPLSVFLLACALLASPPTRSLVAGTSTASPAGTAPTAPPTPLPTPTAPLPSFPGAVAPAPEYNLVEERLLGPYVLRRWHNPDALLPFEDIVTIQASGQTEVRVETVSSIGDLTGSDINGDGFPEVIIETYSGGAHCCFGTQVYSLRERLVLILQKPESNAGGSFQDLNDDGIYEYVTADDLFAYRYCPYVSSPFVAVVLAYDPDRDRYLPASPRFASLYAGDIAAHTRQAEEAQAGDFGEWDETTKCAVLPVILDYLYSGRPEKAHDELLRLYPYPDAEAFWDEVYQAVQSSPLYTPE